MKYSNSPNAYINAQELEVALVKATTYGDALKVFREAPSIEIVNKPTQTDHGYMWTCPKCGLEVHSDFDRCVRCGYEPQTERSE